MKPKQKTRKIKVQYSFSENLVEKLDTFANEMGTTRTGVTVWILQNYFTQKEKMMDKVLSNEHLLDTIKETLSQLHNVNVGESVDNE